ncbi:MAG: nitroreductase family protein [Duncaniella sp.]|nr:nitroreductase family protein [Duncaniella sp.]MDE6177916.1 nitroreductase family protein [Duncaniella sp.]MDE6391608.1 nitroreductase family protein [Duncaniella sp.]
MTSTDKYPQFSALIRERYSCRAYSPAPVPPQTMTAIFEAARLAPSACNRQPWLFLVPKGDDELCAVREAYPRDWFKGAPEYIIVLADTEAAWRRQCDGKLHSDIDIAIAAEHICMAATALDLATCWVCNFDPEALRAAFNIPGRYEPAAIISLGYPAEPGDIPAKTRKSLAEIVRIGKF